MGFKMKGFNPGKGTGMGNSFKRTIQFRDPIKGDIPTAEDYLIRDVGAGYDQYEQGKKTDQERLDDARFTEYRKKLQKSNFGLEINPENIKYNKENFSKWSKKNKRKAGESKIEYQQRFRDVTDEMADLENEAKYLASKGYKVTGKKFGDKIQESDIYKPDPREVGSMESNIELRRQANYAKRRASDLARYKRLEETYGPGNVPESLIPSSVEDQIKKESSRKEKRQQDREQRKEARQQRREARRDKTKDIIEEYIPQSIADQEQETDFQKSIKPKDTAKKAGEILRNRIYLKDITEDDDNEYIPQTQR
jgi:hypothetical protein